MAKAQQVWSQYLHLYSDDPTIPDVLLRQGCFTGRWRGCVRRLQVLRVMSSALK